MVLEKTPESSLDCKEIQPVHSEGDHPWDFFGRNDAKAETPVLWPPQAKSWLIGKDSDAGRDWGQEEKGTTGDEMAGWHHWLHGSESEWTPGVVDGQGGLACWDSWGRKQSDMTERLNWTEMNIHTYIYMYRVYINPYTENPRQKLKNWVTSYIYISVLKIWNLKGSHLMNYSIIHIRIFYLYFIWNVL